MIDLDHVVDIYKDNCSIYDDINDYISEKKVKKINGLSLVHLNIDSVRKKWDTLNHILVDKGAIEDIDIIILTEISIKDNENSIYQIEGFSSVYFNRDRQKGGGICLLYRCNIELDEKWKGKNPISGHECIHVDISVNRSTTSIIAIYRPPNCNSELFIKEIDEYIKQIDKKHDVMVIGDVNIDIKNTTCNIVDRYRNVMADNGLENCIFGYTREALRHDVYTRSSIDHIFIRTNVELISSIIHLHVSDHYMIGVAIGYLNDKSGNVIAKDDNNNKNKIEWKYNENIINSKLSQINWGLLVGRGEESKANTIYKGILHRFKEVYDSAVCRKRCKIAKRVDKVWITIDIKNDIKLRDTAFKKWRGSPTNVMYRNNYKLLRNKVNAKIVKQKNKHMREEIESVRNCIKKRGIK